MKRRWTGFLAAVVILVSSCLPALSTIAAEKEETASRAAAYTAGMERKQADYTVIYTARDGENETVLAKEIFRAPVGETVNIQHKDFKNYAREAGQDMTILVTADGRAVKKVYYTRLFYDRIVFRTEGTYISPIYGWAGRDISDDIAKIKDPVWPGYVFRGWDREIPSVMPEGEYVINALWEPGESRYTVLRWMENAEDEGYTLLGDTEVRTAQTGTVVTASQADIDRAGIMDYYGFDYARCEDVEVTADGRAVLNLYYDREIWTINLHEEAAHESEASDSLVPNDDIWYTAQGKYGAPLPDDFPTMEEMEAYYMGKTQFQDVQFLGVRDEFEAVSRHLDTFYFQDLAVGNHTFDAYPWLERDSYPVYVTYLKESADGRFRKVRVESAQVDKNPAVYGAEITVLHPKGLTCEGGWYTTGNSVEECEQKEKIPISDGQILSDGKCVFRNVGSHLFVYLKRDTFTLNYIDGRNDGESVIYRKEKVTYRDKVSLEYRPEQGEEHSGDRFAGWYLSPALTDSGNPLTVLRIPAQDVNVYAGWYPAEWSVRFEVQGEVEVPGEQIVLDGTLAEIPQEPEREGHIFLGWFSDPGETDVRQAWDFWRPVESDITLYAGWHPVGDTVYTVRHVIEGESDPFYEAAGTGKSGDIIFVRPLYISDEGYPSDQYLETESVGKKITLKQNEDNIITFTYKKTDAEGEETLPDSGREELDSDTTDKGAKPGSGDAGDMPDTGGDDIIPDTGNRAYPHRVILTMAAALCLAAGMALWRKSISGSL